MNYNSLSINDVETIEAAIGSHQGDIAMPRELVDILLRDVRCWPAVRTCGFPFNLRDVVRKV